MSATSSVKGAVVISEVRRVDRTGRLRLPLRFREELAIAYGDYVEIVLENGRGAKVLMVRPVKRGP